jgi:NhaA family Na+:H+ antiporter
MSTENIFIDASQKRIDRRSKFESLLTSTSAALLMIGAAIVALILTNIGFHDPIAEFLETPIGFYWGDTLVGLTVEEFVNDLLMAFFFLLVGCDLKYEMTVGALAKPKQAILPMVAALGGVCGPAIIFLIFNANSGAAHGWAIPTATDIAFALAVMSLFGNRVPVAAKVFFSTLAIADDLVAIVVIALAYSSDINFFWLAMAGVVALLLIALNRAQVYKLTGYALLGAVLWVCFFNSGVHATLAGVVLAFTLPVKSNVNVRGYASWLGRKSTEFDDNYDSELRVLGQHEVTAVARQISDISHRVTPPLQRVEHTFTFFVNFIVLPVFAFVNAQVYIADANMAEVLTSPVTLGVWVGLVVGKPVGILLTTWVLVKFFGFSLPTGARWGHMVGIGMLGGIGFTMAILVDGLAFSDASHIMEGKVGILLGTFTAAVLGLVYMAIYLKISEKRHGTPAPEGTAEDAAAEKAA